MVTPTTDGESVKTKGSTGFLSSFNRRRRHLFDVDLKVERVVSLPFATGRFFFKIRLLNGGNHVYTCDQRFDVHENKVEFNVRDRFPVKMTSRLDTYTLDNCLCRISIRKEGRGGRLYEKIGYYDLDLACVAGCGDESKACLLNGYEQAHVRPANAYLEIRMKLTLLQGDHIFRRPDSDNLYLKVESSEEQTKEPCSDETSSVSSVAGDLHPPLVNMNKRGHSRQPSKTSMTSNQSATSITTSDNNNSRQTSEEDYLYKRQINSRRNPFLDQFGDIQRRLESTRVDATQIVNSVMINNAKPVHNSNGYLRLMFNEDGTAHVASSLMN